MSPEGGLSLASGSPLLVICTALARVRSERKQVLGEGVSAGNGAGSCQRPEPEEAAASHKGVTGWILGGVVVVTDRLAVRSRPHVVERGL